MTIEEIMELKKNDVVKFGINTYIVTSYQVLNTFHLIGFRNIKDPSNKNLMIIKLYDMSIRADIFIDERMTDYSIDFIIKLSGKEVLEIQLKEEQERIRQEIDMSNKKQEEIQKKLVELTLPQIGKMYEIHDVRYGKYAIGVLVSISANGYRMVIANKNVNYQLCNINPSQTKLIPMDSSTDNIAKSILEFIKLGEQQ